MARTAEVVFDEYPDDVFTFRVAPVSLRAYFDFIERWNSPSTIEEFYGELESFVAIAAPEQNNEPLTLEGFKDLPDLGLAKAIVNQWTERVRDVPLPLPHGSSDTTPSQPPETPQPNSSGRKRSTRS